MSAREVDAHGDAPKLDGLTCEEIVVRQFWHEGKLVEPVNAAYLKFGGCWVRLCFDHSIVSWRHGEGPEGDFEAPEIQAVYRSYDIGRRHGFVGLELASMASRPTVHGAEVLLSFDGGRTLTFFDEKDRSDYAC